MSDLNLEIENGVRETETEILNEAFEGAPKAEPEKAEPEQQTQPRDEQGKFAAKEREPETPEAEPEKSAEAEDDKAQVPSWRLREVADEKRALQAERDKLNSELAEMRARMSVIERPKEQPKQEDIDPLLDPQGFAKRLTDQFTQQRAEDRLNFNLGLAHVKHGETFEKAYNALLSEAQAGNRQIVPHMTNQPNPGEAIVKWYKDQQTLKEVGSDPAAYKQKLLDDALKDQAFLAKAIEAAKGAAGQASQGNNITRLPPSLSKATGSSRVVDPDDTDNSDRSVFESAFR